MTQRSCKFHWLALPFLILTGCQISGGSDENVPEDVVINGIRYHHSYNGTIDIINENSWIFASHTRNSCKGKENDACRKIDINYSDKYVPDRVTPHTFEMQLVEWNKDKSPQSVIIFQDWVRIYKDDADGNRPITTLKIEQQGQQLFLRHYDNSWQWNEPAISGNPSWLPPNRLNGEFPIDLGVSYNIELLIHDAGRVELLVNGDKVSDAEYQTKSPNGSHAIQWGLYWNKGYNTEHDPLKRIVLRVDNFNLP